MIRRDPAWRAGFTLIEVVGALLIFSAGVIMMLSATSSLSESLEHAALNSIITAEAQERMDSLGAVTFADLTVATSSDTLTVRGVPFVRTQAIALYSPLVKKIDITIEPASGLPGPTFDASTYVSDVW